MKEIQHLIRSLGVTSKYKGYYFVSAAVHMMVERKDGPVKITKDIYPILAHRFGSSPHNIEHGIRTVVNVSWNNNRETLEKIAGYPLHYKPTNSDFIDMLAFYIVEEQDDSDDDRP